MSGSAISTEPLSTTEMNVPMAMVAKTHHLKEEPDLTRESKSLTSWNLAPEGGHRLKRILSDRRRLLARQLVYYNNTSDI